MGKEEENNIVVLASGNLGLISFTTIEHRLTLEEIMDGFPGLLAGLVEHPGVGFVMINSSLKGAVALGKKGKIYLSTGAVEGANPLGDYSPVTRQNLIRTNTFPNAPDILVVSTYWKDLDEVAAFEQQVASHGGVGGEQSKPFILYPREFQLEQKELLGLRLYTKFLRTGPRGAKNLKSNEFSITFLGVSAASINPFSTTSTCLVEAGNTKIMVDVGIGALRQLHKMHVNPRD